MQSANAPVEPLDPTLVPALEQKPYRLRKAFISYSRKDREMVERLASDLRERGATVWLDVNEIVPGRPWTRQLQRGFDVAEEFLLVISPDSHASDYVDMEFAAARNRKMPIVPILYRRLNAPGKWLFIENTEYVDFTGKYEDGFEDLITGRTKFVQYWVDRAKPYLPVLAILAAIAAVLLGYYLFAPSDTRFTVVTASTKEVVLRVENSGGRPSMLLGGTFKIDFGKVPIEPEDLVLLDPSKAARIGGHSHTNIRLKLADVERTPKKKDQREYYSKTEVTPLISGATLTITGQVKESGERLLTRRANTAGARLQAFILEGYPDDVPRSHWQ